MTLHTHIKLVTHLIYISLQVKCSFVTEDIFNKLETALRPLGIPLQYSKVPTLSTPFPEVPPLQPLQPPPDPSAPPSDSSSADPQSSSACPSQSIVYIGSECLGLTNLLMTNAHSNVSRLILRYRLGFSLIAAFLRYIHTTLRQMRHASSPHARTSSLCVGMPLSRKHEMLTSLESWLALSASVRIMFLFCLVLHRH